MRVLSEISMSGINALWFGEIMPSRIGLSLLTRHLDIILQITLQRLVGLKSLIDWGFFPLGMRTIVESLIPSDILLVIKKLLNNPNNAFFANTPIPLKKSSWKRAWASILPSGQRCITPMMGGSVKFQFMVKFDTLPSATRLPANLFKRSTGSRAVRSSGRATPSTNETHAMLRKYLQHRTCCRNLCNRGHVANIYFCNKGIVAFFCNKGLVEVFCKECLVTVFLQ